MGPNSEKAKKETAVKNTIRPDLAEIRNKSQLYKLYITEPHIYTWLTSDHANKDIKEAIKI